MRAVEQLVEARLIDDESRFTQRAGLPQCPDPVQARQLEVAGRLQSRRVIEPEAHPALQVFGRPVFALRREPGHFHVHFIGGEQRRAATAAEADHHAGLGQLPHCRLGDGGAGAEQQCGGVGDGDVPVARALAFVGDVLDAAAVHQYPAVLQVVQVGALGMQDGLEVAGAEIIH